MLKFTCQQTDLLRGIGLVERAVSTKDTMAALSGVLVDAKEGRLRLVATDLELAIECFIAANVVEPGSAVINGKTLSQIVRKSPAEQISFAPEPPETVRIDDAVSQNAESEIAAGDETSETSSSGRVRIESGSAQFVVSTLDGGDFPELPRVGEADWIDLPEERLRRLMRHTLFAAADDDGRPFLSGVCVEVEGRSLRAVATDSYQLALDKVELASEHQPVRTILPRRTVQELIRVFGDNDEAGARFCIAENQAVFEVEGVTLISRLIEGDFPNYAQVFPREQPTIATLGRSALLAALDRAIVIAQRGTPWVQLEVRSEGRLIVTAREAEVGRVREELTVTVSGEPNTNTYNARYLIEMLRSTNADEVHLEVRPGTQQGTIRLADDPGFIYIIMPTVIHQ